jgi:hypothetical protein
MKKRKAIFTYARNEALYFPIWLKHHLKSFPREDVYVLDNDTCDGSIEDAINKGLLLKENVFAISCKDNFTSQWLSDEASNFQNQLLSKYDWTVLAEVDELIAINPSYFSSWEDFLLSFENSGKTFCKALGYDIVHNAKSEPPIDLEKPILSQRSYARVWKPELNGGKMTFSKPILSKSPVKWRGGGHELYQDGDKKRASLRIDIEEALLLFHLNMFDFNLCAQRRLERVPSGQQQIDGDRLWVGQKLIDEMNGYLSHPATTKIPHEFTQIF